MFRLRAAAVEHAIVIAVVMTRIFSGQTARSTPWAGADRDHTPELWIAAINPFEVHGLLM